MEGLDHHRHGDEEARVSKSCARKGGWITFFFIAANTIGLSIFLLGKRFYRTLKPKDSPFVGLARVFIASIRKKNVLLSSKTEDYYHGEIKSQRQVSPSNSFRFLNGAAVIVEGDLRTDGSIAKPWRLCSVQQLEDLKSVIDSYLMFRTCYSGAWIQTIKLLF